MKARAPCYVYVRKIPSPVSFISFSTRLSWKFHASVKISFVRNNDTKAQTRNDTVSERNVAAKSKIAERAK